MGVLWSCFMSNSWSKDSCKRFSKISRSFETSSSKLSCSDDSFIFFILSLISFIFWDALFWDFDALPDLFCCIWSELFFISCWMSCSNWSVFSSCWGSSNCSFFFWRSSSSFRKSSNSLFRFSWSFFKFSGESSFFSVFSANLSCWSFKRSNLSMAASNFCSNSSCLNNSSERSSSFSMSLFSNFICSIISLILFLSRFSIIFSSSLSLSFISSLIICSKIFSNSFCFSKIRSSDFLNSSFLLLFSLFSFFRFSICCSICCCWLIRSWTFFLSCQLISFFSRILLFNSSSSFWIFLASFSVSFKLFLTDSLFWSRCSSIWSRVGTLKILFCVFDDFAPFTPSLSHTSNQYSISSPGCNESWEKSHDQKNKVFK